MRRFIAVFAVGFALLGAAQVASASCGSQVISDGMDDGVIQGNYSVPCLKQALGLVHGDASTYTDIQPVIQAKIYAESRAKAQTPGDPPSSSADGRTQAGVNGVTPQNVKPGDPKSTTENGTTSNSDPSSTGSSDSANPPVTTDKGLHAAIDKLGPKKATDVPVPVIVLGLLALGLIIVGSAGLIMRRRRDASTDDDPLTHL